MPINIQIYLANFSFCTLFVSMIFYWIQTSQFGRLENSALSIIQPNLGIDNKIEISDNFFLRSVDSNNFSNLKKFNFGIILMLLSNLSIFLILILRWNESGHFPLSNLYESLMFLSWSLTFLHIWIEFGTFNFLTNLMNSNFTTNGNYKLKKILTKKKIFLTKLIGSITSPCALFTNAFASFSLPPEMQESSPLVPALQSNWLMMHVTVMILSYAALILGSLLAIGFLVITGGKDFKKDINLIQNSSVSLSNSNFLTNRSQGSFELSVALDNLSYRILGIGFPLLTIGILSGAVWANEAWGSYWSWDPKETWALLTWLVFAIYLHTRLTKGWAGKKPALIASLGFITVWVCYLGVNLIGEGLHSYGWL